MENERAGMRAWQETERFRKDSFSWFLCVEVLGDSISGGTVAWWLWNRSRLQGWQVWLIAFGVVVTVPFMIYGLIFLRNLILAPSRIRKDAEFEIAKKLGGISIPNVFMFQTAFSWMRSIFIAPVAFVEKHVEDGYFRVSLEIRSENSWKYLEKHGNPLVKDLRDWENLVHTSLVEANKLLNAIQCKIKDMFPDIPMRDDINSIDVDRDIRPFLTITLVANLFNMVFKRAVAGISDAPLEEWQIERDERCVYYPNRSYAVMCSDDPEQRDDICRLLVDHKFLLELGEVELARQAFKNMEMNTDILRAKFQDILADTEKLSKEIRNDR